MFPNDIESFDSNTTSIQISNYSINNKNYSIFDFSRFTLLEELIIGDDCYEYVELFNIDGLNELKSLKIGMNSFTMEKNSWGNNRNRSFAILNCIELESIEIGHHSFSDYGGGFELKNLPKLSTIKLGSSNFRYSSFVIEGIIDTILIMNRSSTFEFHCIRMGYIPIFLINNNIKYLNDLSE